VDKDDTTVTETVFVESLGPLGHVNVSVMDACCSMLHQNGLTDYLLKPLLL
jgi:hypothetical protein